MSKSQIDDLVKELNEGILELARVCDALKNIKQADPAVVLAAEARVSEAYSEFRRYYDILHKSDARGLRAAWIALDFISQNYIKTH